MPYVPDLFGKLCWEFHSKGIDAPLGIQLDNGVLMEDFPVSIYVNPKEMRPIEKRFLRHVKGRVLDLGCGPGRVALYLQANDYEVFGIDKSPHMVQLAKARGINVAKLDFNKPLAEWKQQLGPQRFHSVVMYGNGLGSPGTLRNLCSVLERLLIVTTEDAILVGESNDPFRMQLEIDEQYQKRNVRLGRFSGQRRWRQVSKQNYGEWHDWVQIPPSQLAKVADLSGWKSQGPVYEKNGLGTKWGAYFAVLKKN